VEIRPVISGGAAGRSAKCSRCRRPAVIELRRHNAAFCGACFQRHVVEQVRRAVRHHRMLEPGQRVMVAVSGGKDSLALWDILLELGHPVTGMYLDLGIGEYSERSGAAARAFAAERGAELVSVGLHE